MRHLSLCAAAAIIGMSTCTMALAQNAGGAAGGAVGGAATGAVVGGPVGAAVGGAVGAIVGSSLPSHPAVTYERPVVVGEELPRTVTVYPVPEHDEYDYTVIGKRKVIIDRHNRKIVRVIE
ncbi:MAG: Blp family class II bacteriocin [Hyphomicrobiales bacterium]|nr:Blp family class II bacteriocin [Hyphomicrobiales bacterium]